MRAMKVFKSLFTIPVVFVLFAVGALSSPGTAPAGESANIRALVVTGGHDFEKEPFFAMFKSFADVAVQAAEHPKAQALFRPDAARNYDVLVLYDMWQKIDEETKANFVNLLKDGKGLVVLHHAIANYNDWSQYAEIVGARYYLKKVTVNGQEKGPSLWKHDVKFTVQIADPQHPVTRGLKDFEIHDETYNLFDVDPGVKPLLTATEPTSGKVIGWAKEVEKSRLVYIQLGHDHFAYENPSLRKLVQQALRWTARKD